MELSTTTVPGGGVLHDFLTRDGQRFRIIVDRSNVRELHVYGDDGESRPVASIVLEADEADRAAEILHSTPTAERLAEIERRIAELAGGS